MKKVVFVGDCPSPLNTAKSIAFVGSKSFPRLVEWIKAIDADFYICLNSSPGELLTIGQLMADGFKVIALGNAASERLEGLQIPHYALPHPSGRNRKVNVGVTVETWLDLAKTYVEASGVA